jgi:YVTN family beta-propeller protein
MAAFEFQRLQLSRMRTVVAVTLSMLAVVPVAAGPSNSQLDITPDGKLLLVANADNGTVTVVNLNERKALREVAVGDHPEGVVWIGNGPLAVVTVNRDDRVAFVDTSTGKVVAALSCAAEPYGIVATRDGKRAYVSHDYPGLVSEIDLEKRQITRAFRAGEWARGLALSADDSRLYVTNFYTAALTAIDLVSGKIIDTWPGRESDNLCRHVVLHPRRPKAYLTHLRSRTHIIDARGSIFPELSICTLTPPRPEEKRRTAIALDTFNGVYVTANPWESAISPDGKTFITVYAGTDDMNFSAVIDDDYREIEQAGVLSAGKHPRAVRFSPDGSELYVYSTLDFSVNVYSMTGGRPAKSVSIKVCEPPHTPAWVRGKELFVSSKPPMTRARWISCSACHPDGFQDGRVWQNPEGPRKTPPLWGLGHTHPVHYSADRDEVQDFEYTIRGKLMDGAGLVKGAIKPRTGFVPPAELDEKLAGRSKDLDALAIYTNSFQPKLSPHIAAPGKLTPEAERGKSLFYDQKVGCATCHRGPYYTDSSLKRPFTVHDVGTGGGPTEKMPPSFDTPTLLGVYRAPPYLHDGRAKTLLDVLTTANPADKHGKTSHLSQEQLAHLVAFLKSLPYETPPDETPNTVRDRVKLKSSRRRRSARRQARFSPYLTAETTSFFSSQIQRVCTCIVSFAPRSPRPFSHSAPSPMRSTLPRTPRTPASRN